MTFAQRRFRILTVAAVLFAACPWPSGAQESVPHAIIMLPPEASASAELAALITHWRADGLIEEAQQLDAAPQDSAGFSSLALLEIAGEQAWQGWQRDAESRLPAGSRVRRADVVVEGELPDHDPARALYEVNVYRIKTTVERYREFCLGYISPLMQGQSDAGLMSAYTMFTERGPDGDRHAVLVKAYRDASTYAGIAAFKLELRERLTTRHPTYPRWHPIKDTLRDNVSETLATSTQRTSRD
ncbi:MAG: hypothetical protein HC872_02685 [Gammaproteobacteria bacterium]|nr:hypothetical protein [Gammaproteobacteria bacterium]